MEYISFEARSRRELEADLASNDPRRIQYALLSAAYHDPNWHWVEEQALRFIHHSEEWLRRGAIQALGLIAVFHKQVDIALVVPLLQDLCSDPLFGAEAENMLEDIYHHVPTSRPN